MPAERKGSRIVPTCDLFGICALDKRAAAGLQDRWQGSAPGDVVKYNPSSTIRQMFADRTYKVVALTPQEDQNGEPRLSEEFVRIARKSELACV